MPSDHTLKHHLFDNYRKYCLGAFGVAVSLLFFGLITWQVLAVIVGGIGSFGFGVQKQQIEEVRLFKELFEKFNERMTIKMRN